MSTGDKNLDSAMETLERIIREQRAELRLALTDAGLSREAVERIVDVQTFLIESVAAWTAAAQAGIAPSLSARLARGRGS